MPDVLLPQMRACVAAAVKAHGDTEIVDALRLARTLADAMPVPEWRAPIADIQDEIARVAISEKKPLKLANMSTGTAIRQRRSP